MAAKHFFEERESKNLEFKSTLPKFDTLIKTCIAFANGVGGRIIIGVEDEDRQVCGVSEETKKRVYDEFPNSLYDSTSPSLVPQIYEKNFNDVSVLIIQIGPSQTKPCFNLREGLPKGVYLRVGSNTRRATQEYIEELMRESKRVSYDEELVHEPIEILSNELIEDVFEGPMTKRRLMAEKIIAQSASNPEVYFPTITGVMHCCEDPHMFIPEASVICTQFRGVEGRHIIQTQEIYGNLELQATTCMSLVEAWISRSFHLHGAKLKAETAIPSIALRESIINALIHRKYSIPGAIKIAVWEDRVEIFSPGGFPGLVDINHLGDGTTYLRNPNIARIARKIGLVEKMGTGIKLMFESCRRARLQLPEFHEEGDFVKVVFSFKRVPSHDQSDELLILKLAKRLPEISVSEVMEYLGVSRNTATRKLNTLLKRKQLHRRGQGPSVKYILADEES
ncbi:MAG: hypothetical protein S4CHLAM102_08810 [Chlamydiia bacterium]|nr:hypothetical protein [Chlamydiia bacterium]